MHRAAWTFGTAFVLSIALVCPPSVAAQPAPALATPSRLLPSAAFHFQWGSMASSDPRFAWDAVMGMDLDLASYPHGAVTFRAEYEAILGNQIRAFELNHENFALEGGASYDLRTVTVTAAFRHVSRHLSDRPNPNIIAWNLLDGRVRRTFVAGRTHVTGEISAGHVLQRTFVDYDWMAALGIAARRPIDGRLALFAGGTGQLVGVDAAKVGRGGQCGARLEAGVRIAGQAAAVEIFAGYERRIDGYPTERTRMRALTVGFRLTSR